VRPHARGHGSARHREVGVEVHRAEGGLAARHLDGGVQGEVELVGRWQRRQVGEVDSQGPQLGVAQVQIAAGQRVHLRHRRVGQQGLQHLSAHQAGGASEQHGACGVHGLLSVRNKTNRLYLEANRPIVPRSSQSHCGTPAAVQITGRESCPRRWQAMNTPLVSDTWERGSPYEQYIGRWSRKAAPLFLEWLDQPQGQRWLDVGCGTGALTGAILDRCGPVSVVGLEPSEGFIKAAHQNLVGKARFLAGNAAAIPQDDGACDVVVSGLVLNFIPDLPVALAEMARVAVAGGTVAAYVWDAGPLRCGQLSSRPGSPRSKRQHLM